jgi:hypothetical protein
MLSEAEKQQKRQEKKEKIIQIRKTLSQMSEEQQQAIAAKFGIITVEGHPLTPYNQCFLVSQSEINFSIVGGYVQWKRACKAVRKGQHGFLILVPSVPKKEENLDTYLDNEDVHFYSATVFDISQTVDITNSEAE